MKTFIKQITWLVTTEHGWGNGYVLIPKGHKLHGVDYNNINVNVHGGLTFAKLAKECVDYFNIEPEDIEGWLIGFDTAHSNDTIEDWSKERVEEETNKLKEQLENYKD